MSALKQSSAAIEGAQAKLAEAQLNLSYTSVKAPISGITGRAVRSEGSLVTANTDSSLLTTLTQVNPIWVRFSLAEPDFERIRGAEKNAQVKLLNEDETVAASNGRLNFAGSTVDPKLGTVQLRAEFPNPALKWLPGQFVKVQILAGEQEAFLVPQAAGRADRAGAAGVGRRARRQSEHAAGADGGLDRVELGRDGRAQTGRRGDRRQPDEAAAGRAGAAARARRRAAPPPARRQAHPAAAADKKASAPSGAPR